jgi:dTDP-4-dehydrorhamnose 3,5-epimerase
VITPEVYCDFRGENLEAFNQEEYGMIFEQYRVPKLQFVVDSLSVSRKDTLRGFHGDFVTWKLLQCLHGALQLVVIDVKPDSRTYKKTEAFHLNDKNRKQVLLPPGCVNAHLCISETCIFNYKLSRQFTRQDQQLHIRWNDPEYKVYWPVANPILSQRDA